MSSIEFLIKDQQIQSGCNLEYCCNKYLLNLEDIETEEVYYLKDGSYPIDWFIIGLDYGAGKVVRLSEKGIKELKSHSK